MNLFVVDTHALHWYITGDRQLSRRVKALLDSLVEPDSPNHVYVPTLVFAEILALEEKRATLPRFEAIIQQVERMRGFTVVSLTSEIVQTARNIVGVKEMFDRLIAATALSLEARLLTRDAVLSSLAMIETVW